MPARAIDVAFLGVLATTFEWEADRRDQLARDDPAKRNAHKRSARAMRDLAAHLLTVDADRADIRKLRAAHPEHSSRRHVSLDGAESNRLVETFGYEDHLGAADFDRFIARLAHEEEHAWDGF